jgi:hypothetical protein
MLAKPNQTVIEGTVRAIRADEGGFGTNVEIEVDRNVSPSDDADFLKTQRGEVLTVFSPELPATEIGQHVRLHARLLGGPRGQRVILEKIEPANG